MADMYDEGSPRMEIIEDTQIEDVSIEIQPSTSASPMGPDKIFWQKCQALVKVKGWEATMAQMGGPQPATASEGQLSDLKRDRPSLITGSQESIGSGESQSSKKRLCKTNNGQRGIKTKKELEEELAVATTIIGRADTLSDTTTPNGGLHGTRTKDLHSNYGAASAATQGTGHKSVRNKEFLVLLLTILVVEGIAVAQKTQDALNLAVKHIPPPQCGIWVRTSNGGHFASPNFPDTYPPNKECVYILEAAPRQRIELTFDDPYHIEPSFECRFDHLEVRDGPFGFSPLIDRYCGLKSPTLIRSTGRFMWIKFSSDEELEGLGFRAKYSFIPDPDFTYLGGILNPIPDCQFEMAGADGLIRSSQVEQEEKTKPGQPVDCIWTIKATSKAKIYLRFLDYQMEHSNECKRNFVAVYDGSSSIENLKAKFCSTMANDVMLQTGTGVVRMWADEGSRLSRFRMLFTSFVDPPCTGSSFFCHSNMCINNSLVCNGVQNCAYPWDENHCKEKKEAGLFEQITKTHGTIIGISSGIVLVLLIISIFVQVKQPRKKVMARKTTFNKSGFQEVFDPPHYELFSLRDKEISADLADLSEELENYQKMRRSSTSSRCIHDHHCGSQTVASIKQSRTNLSSMDLPFRNDFAQPQPMKTFNSTFKKSNYNFKQTHDCPEQGIEDRVMEEIPCEIYARGREEPAQGSISMDF